MPAGIPDARLLQLLGDILRPTLEPVAVGWLRLRLMGHGFSWQALIELATGQDVLAPLIHALTSRALLPPIPRVAKAGHEGHVTNRLNEFQRAHAARRSAERAQLESVLEVLNRADIVPLVLKGGRYIVAPHAPWCEARTIRDLDLLVRPADAARALAALQADGYRSNSPYMDNWHHRPDLERPGQPASIEIHTEALAVAGQKLMRTDFVWGNAVPIESRRCLVLPAPWQALHCVLHHAISDRGYRREILAIKALWEWTMLAQEFSAEDWEAIVAHMRRAGATDVLGSWLVQSHRLLGADIPDIVEISPAARVNAEATFRWASRPHWMRRARFIADQLRFSFAPETLAQRYGKPASDIRLRDAGTYVVQLVRRHRGGMRKRLLGERDRPS